MSTQSDNILRILKVNLPGAMPKVVNLALGETVTDLCRDGLSKAGPPDYGTDPGGWLLDDEWVEHHTTIVSGVLARMMSQAGKPYSNAEMASAHAALFSQGVIRARTNAQTTVSLANSAYTRLMLSVRIAVPTARDAAINQAVFRAADELARDALQITPPAQTVPPEQWLPASAYAEHHQHLVDGALAVLYAQGNQPWANPDFAKFHLNAWELGQRLARANAQGAGPAAQPYERVLQTLRTAVPNARDNTLLQYMYRAASTLARSALQRTPPVASSPPAEWLSADEYAEYQGLLTDGALTHALLDVGQPWANPDLAKGIEARWAAGLDRARELGSSVSSSNDGFSRVMANVRFAVPGVRDTAIHQELFNTVDEFSRNVLQRDPPSHNAAPTAWLTAQEYNNYFRLLTAGTLYRLFMQSNKPWTDLKAAALQQQVYSDEVATTRSDAGDDAAVNPTDRLMSSIRADLPGAKDAVILQALFEVLDEACRHAHVWVEPIQVTLTPGRQVFTVEVPGADIVRVASIGHTMLGGCAQYGGNGRVYVSEPFDAAVAKEPLNIVAALVPTITVDISKPEEWIPSDLWGPLHQMLLHGVLSRLMLKPGKPYSNTQLAQFHGQKHRRFLMQAKNETKAAGIVPANPTWRFPRFAQ